jgi:hypothetical protein
MRDLVSQRKALTHLMVQLVNASDPGAESKFQVARDIVIHHFSKHFDTKMSGNRDNVERKLVDPHTIQIVYESV